MSAGSEPVHATVVVSVPATVRVRMRIPVVRLPVVTKPAPALVALLVQTDVQSVHFARPPPALAVAA